MAEPTVSVMVAALPEEQPSWRNGRIVDLLFFIVRGDSETDPTLQDRCRDRAREGLWLLARWALTHQGWESERHGQRYRLSPGTRWRTGHGEVFVVSRL